MYQLPKLPYNYNALEPYIDGRTMEIHHTKHHQGYIDKLNKAFEDHPNLQDKPIEDLLWSLDTLPEEIRGVIRNNGGGHYNHSLFWQIMSPHSGEKPGDELAAVINKNFGGLEKFQEEFNDKAGKIFGSGWCWLIKDGDVQLKILTTPNQDSPVMEGIQPLLGLDVWEHAYYLNYQNRRPDYIKAWWNVINWNEVAKRYGA